MAAIRKQPILTHVELVRALDYNENTGVFTWAEKIATCVVIGRVAGSSTSNGYQRIRIFGTEHLAHRLAWCYVHGEWPERLIDHIDGNRQNNAIGNLRLATFSENIQNQKKATARNRCGLLGVSLERQTGLFKASINIGGRSSKTLGRFKTAEEAHGVYLDAKRKHHAGCVL